MHFRANCARADFVARRAWSLFLSSENDERARRFVILGKRHSLTRRTVRDGISSSSERNATVNSRLSALEVQLRHVEAALEGLQDAVHRRSQLDDKRNDILLRRTDLAGDVSDDAHNGQL